MGTAAEKVRQSTRDQDGSGEAGIEVLWLERIARRDRSAFEELYREYGPRVFRFAVRMIRDETKAEEVMNDVMVEIWKSAGQFKGRSKASTWIFSIARHRALNAVRRKQLPTTGLDDAVEIRDETEDPMASTDQQTTSDLLRTAIDQLSNEHREVVELTFFHGLNYKEIAKIAECPEGTVKTRMFHAKKQLGPLLTALGVTGTTL
ncbi:MAG: sigma-70 family RNA polymerase sigma factor [Gammaproteobacteria bacterium]